MPTFKAKVVDEKSGDALQVILESRKVLSPASFDSLIAKLKEQHPELDSEAGPSPEDEEAELASLENKNQNLLGQKDYERLRFLQSKKQKGE